MRDRASKSSVIRGTLYREKKDLRYLKFLIYILPAFLLWFVFQIFPNLRIFGLALYDWDGMSPDMTFVGLQNFKNLTLDPTFPAVFGNTIFYIIVVTGVQISIGVLFAVLLKKNTTFNNFSGHCFFRRLSLEQSWSPWCGAMYTTRT